MAENKTRNGYAYYDDIPSLRKVAYRNAHNSSSPISEEAVIVNAERNKASFASHVRH
jgi:hypothetical protein